MRGFYFVALVCINGYFLAVALSNIVYFRRATRAPRIRGGQSVSVIVPARNEDGSIARCLDSLLAQDYADYEVVVVDDESRDATADIVAAYASRDPRLRLVSGAPLPDGWLGKPHALAQGVRASRGAILILTDADAVHEPDSVSWAVTNLVDHRADMLSGYPRQEYGSLGERIVVPTMYAMMLLVPLFLIPRTRSRQLSFAIGQYVAVRREALDGVGGFEAIRDSIVDDVSMATLIKERGYRDIFLDAKRAASCRLYSGYRDAFAGISRSVYSALGASPLTVLLVAAIVLGLIVGPALALPAWYLGSGTPAMPIAVAVVLFAALWALIAWDRDVPVSAVVFYPLVFLNLLAMMVNSMLTTGFGPGVDWKGRLVHVPRSRAGAEPDADAADCATKTGKLE